MITSPQRAVRTVMGAEKFDSTLRSSPSAMDWISYSELGTISAPPTCSKGETESNRYAKTAIAFAEAIGSYRDRRKSLGYF